MQENNNIKIDNDVQQNVDKVEKELDSNKNLVVPTSESSENSTKNAKNDILEDIKENTNEYSSMKEIHRQSGYFRLYFTNIAKYI